MSFDSMVVITFLSDFRGHKNKIYHCFQFPTIYLPWIYVTGCFDINIFLMLSVKPGFSLSSFTLIKKLLCFSLYAIRVESSAYLSLLIFLLAILIPVCASSSPAFCMMYSAYKLNSRVKIHSFDVLLSQLGTSPLFRVRF